MVKKRNFIAEIVGFLQTSLSSFMVFSVPTKTICSVFFKGKMSHLGLGVW